jgi:hypothetical protein
MARKLDLDFDPPRSLDCGAKEADPKPAVPGVVEVRKGLANIRPLTVGEYMTRRPSIGQHHYAFDWAFLANCPAGDDQIAIHDALLGLVDGSAAQRGMEWQRC